MARLALSAVALHARYGCGLKVLATAHAGRTKAEGLGRHPSLHIVRALSLATD